MKNTSKILALLLVVVMAFTSLAVITASAATTTVRVYLDNEAGWSGTMNCYYWGGSNAPAWPGKAMTKDSNGYWYIDIPAGHGNCIFNNGSTQTADLKVPTGNATLYNNKTKTWSNPSSTCEHVGGDAATCTTPQLCTKCGEAIVAALGHSYNSKHACTRCSAQASFTIAGTGAHLGTEWDTTNKANDMTYDPATETYTKIYQNVAKGTYKFKCARDHTWGTAYPGSDKSVTVNTAGSTLIITLKGTSVTAKAVAPHICEDNLTAATCTSPAKCNLCTLTYGDALGHSFSGGACTVCGEADPDACKHESKTEVNTATCLEAGKHYFECDGCHEIFDETEVSALGHNYVNGDCSRCDYVEVYFVNSSKWSKVSFYYWGSDSDPAWPGNTVAKTGETVNGFDVYKADVSSSWGGFIFNNGGNGSQTSDLVAKGNAGKYYYPVDTKWYASISDIPALDPLATGNYLPGSFNDWSATKNEFRLLNEGDKVAYVSLELKANTTYTFKITIGGTWYGYNTPIKASVSGVAFTTSGGDVTLTTKCAGVYVFALEGTKLSIEFAEHTEVIDEAKAPTCTETGLTEGKHCSVCGKVLTAQEVVDALGHSYEANVTAPTCTEGGYTTYTCSCGHSYVADEVAATGHSYAEGVCGTCGAADPDYVAPEPPAGDVTMKDYIFDPNEFGEFSGANDSKTSADGFFTFYMSNSKNESKKKEFEDGFVSTFRFSLNGNSKVEDGSFARTIMFTTEGKGKVTIWWELGNTGRVLELYDANGKLVESTSLDLAKGIYITTFEIDAAGTYYLAHTAGTVYFYKVVVSVEEKACEHDWADATCQAPKTCKLCGETEGEVIDHNYVDGSCTMCGAEDPTVCKHPNMQDATCELPKTCPDCGATEGEALGHSYADATCTAPKTCTVCGGTDGKPLGHTYEFVTTLPTFEIPGKTTVKCLVCDFAEEFDAVNVMGEGQHVLDASVLDGIGAGDFYDGKVTVIDGKFACHLSAKYKTESNAKDFVDGYAATHRMNFGGKSEWTNNGEGDEAVKNGGLKNFIQITTSGETTITVYWVCSGNGRQVGIYTVDGTRVAVSEGDRTKNSLYISEFKLEAGTYLIGTDCENAESGGGNYFYKIVVDVKAEEQACAHDWADATCESPKTCKLCGETEGEALGHSYKDGACSVCGDEDPNYVPPVEEPVEKGFFARIWEAILNFIQKLLGIFNKK